MQLTVDNLSKNYRGGVEALRNVQLSLKPGVLGLLGPNGAGKSTLMRILATITQASSGRVLWNDTDSRAIPMLFAASSAIFRKTSASIQI
jgi:ABC-2 type transport system ATP-binding protein